MIVIGISLGFNSSVSIWNDAVCLCSLSEERLTGNKNTKSLPLTALRACWQMVKKPYPNVVVAYSSYEELTNRYLQQYGFEHMPFDSDAIPNVNLKKIIEWALDISVEQVIRVEHHTAHAYSAYAIYGYDVNSTTLTCDGFGDGISARLIVKGETVAELPLEKSPALYYQFVTGALGFKMHQHEGKVTGIATGNYTKNTSLIDTYYSFFMDLWLGRIPLKCDISDADEKLIADNKQIIDFDKFVYLRKRITDYIKYELPADYCVDNILLCDAAICFCVAVQNFAKAVVLNFLCKAFDNKTRTIYLAGGMFANVAINRTIGNIYSRVCIAPAMGDEGTAMGAAAYYVAQTNKLFMFNPEYIINGGILSGSGDDVLTASIFANALEKNKIVHLVSGRNEFGPRALMHRSSIFTATDRTITSLLNSAMHRNEYMPYAPVVRAENVSELFEDYEPFEESLHFMTVALKAKPATIQKYKGAVHNDGTCRVQVVHCDVLCERFAWLILEEWEKRTGEKMLINTSFNVHNKPTCCTEEQCEDAWNFANKIGRILYRNAIGE